MINFNDIIFSRKENNFGGLEIRAELAIRASSIISFCLKPEHLEKEIDFVKGQLKLAIHNLIYGELKQPSVCALREALYLPIEPTKTESLVANCQRIVSLLEQSRI